jgi:copper homeostasis protein
MKKTVALEFCITDFTGAEVAHQYGADRIELCTDLKVGGLTPSFGLIKSCVEIIETHVLIRPRAGSFQYRKEEIKLMIADIVAVHHAGARGVVFGCLTSDGKIDIPANQQMMAICKEKGLFPTFHRAFDRITDDGVLALEALIDLGFKRILTSGHAPRAIEGIATLRHWHKKAAGRIQLMAGGGVEPDNAKELIAAGMDALHCSIHQKDNTISPMGGELVYNHAKALQMKAIVDGIVSS